MLCQAVNIAITSALKKKIEWTSCCQLCWYEHQSVTEIWELFLKNWHLWQIQNNIFSSWSGNSRSCWSIAVTWTSPVDYATILWSTESTNGFCVQRKLDALGEMPLCHMGQGTDCSQFTKDSQLAYLHWIALNLALQMYLKKIGSRNKLWERIQRRLISDNQNPMLSLIKIFNRSESHSSSRANLNPSVMQVQLTLTK